MMAHGPGYYANRREKTRSYLAGIRSGLSCSLCGESDPRCLDFHHIDPSQKTMSISQMSSKNYNLARLRKEIEKCTVLCANCHRKEHAGNG